MFTCWPFNDDVDHQNWGFKRAESCVVLCCVVVVVVVVSSYCFGLLSLHIVLTAASALNVHRGLRRRRRLQLLKLRPLKLLLFMLLRLPFGRLPSRGHQLRRTEYGKW